ncbi:MAG: fumarate reductase/succinate dehydrogenase flavoprotein subunit [Gammaproteobacteria bacterium]|nr:fumarate reductase/succinate dehydrogenase flavoprotein subunit [Gammaproteobacteria bacterium]
MPISLDPRIPDGALADKWANQQANFKLVSPNNKAKYKVIVIGSGLAGASAAATLAEQGYQVDCFSFNDSPRRAHSVAAQGGINAAKNYRNDGDSTYRLFYDTIKGGDFRSREANVYRLAEVSGQIIDHCVAQGIPFARDYAGYLDSRSFGGVQVSRTFYARGQTGQQLLLGAYGALNRQIHLDKVRMFTRSEMLDVVVEDGVAQGIIVRNLVSGEVSRFNAHAVIIASGGYSNMFYLSTNALSSNVTATYRAYKQGALFANPAFTQIPPTCIPASGEHQSKLTLMSESLRNDGRIWVPAKQGEHRSPADIPQSERDYFLERRYPAFGNLVPRDIASRAVKQVCDKGLGVGPTGHGVYLDLADAIESSGKDVIEERYGNLFEMYQRITSESPEKSPMRIYPAAHYTMGGLWVDYHLMSNIKGLFVIGEANFSDHGANRLGASALMQGLADGYFIVPSSVSHYLAEQKPQLVDTNSDSFNQTGQAVENRVADLLSIKGKHSADYFHRKLGKLMWDNCGMARSERGLKKALDEIPKLSEQFWQQLKITGSGKELNFQLEKAGRVADFLEFSQLVCQDALHRNESCGGHFREESQNTEGEALRNDDDFSYVAAWQYKSGKTTNQPAPATLHKEPLKHEAVAPDQRSYK